jgi:hypothetical protein
MAHSSNDCILAEEDCPMTFINRLLCVVRGRCLEHEPEHSQRRDHGAHELGGWHPDEGHSGLVARTVNSVTVVSQAAALAAASGLLLAACGGGSSTASQSTAASSTAARSASAAARPGSGGNSFCGAARRFGNAQKTFARYAEKEPASVMAKMLSVATDAESALGDMQRLAPASLTADVKVYVSTEKPIVDGIVANRGELKQQIEKDKKNKRSDTGNNPKLQRALAGIGDKCGFPGSLLMPMPRKGMPMPSKG